MSHLLRLLSSPTLEIRVSLTKRVFSSHLSDQFSTNKAESGDWYQTLCLVMSSTIYNQQHHCTIQMFLGSTYLIHNTHCSVDLGLERWSRWLIWVCYMVADFISRKKIDTFFQNIKTFTLKFEEEIFLHYAILKL